MQMRTLGTLNIPVSPVMLGGNVFGWTIDEATSFAVLDRFADRGFNFIDTADVYSSWVPGTRAARAKRSLASGSSRPASARAWCWRRSSATRWAKERRA